MAKLWQLPGGFGFCWPFTSFSKSGGMVKEGYM